MATLNFCTSLLLLCLARGSLQGGVKPQANGRGGLYLPYLVRGAGGAGLGPAGAKAGKYPAYGTQGLSPGLRIQNRFEELDEFVEANQRSEASSSYDSGQALTLAGWDPPFANGTGYGIPAGYGGAGYRGLGYPRTGLPLGGLGARGKPSKAGYGAGPSAAGYQAYPGGVGAGGYPSNGLQNGYSNGYGAGGNGFPGARLHPGGYSNGNGVQAPYGSQLGGPAGDSVAAKYGGAGQLPYSGQPHQPEAAGLGGDYSAGRYGGPQLVYGSQPGQMLGLDGNGNGMGYMNGGDPQANGLGAGAYGPLAAGQTPGGYGSPLGPGQALGGYGGKESKYGMNGFMGNGYRVRCPSGKC